MEKESYLKVYFDGGSRGNPGPSAIGAVIYDENGRKLSEISEFIGEKTNNLSEYIALDRALDLAGKYREENGKKKILVFTDSKLLYSQLKGVWKVKDSNIHEIYSSIAKKLSEYEVVDLRLIPREDNREADRLVNLALDTHGNKHESSEDKFNIRFGRIED